MKRNKDGNDINFTVRCLDCRKQLSVSIGYGIPEESEDNKVLDFVRLHHNGHRIKMMEITK